MVKRRKDNKNRVLREGESQRADGTYDFRWRTKNGKRHSVYAATLEKLREKEDEIFRDKMDGIKTDAKNTTVNDMFELWLVIKKGLKDNTFQNYKYMYKTFVEPDFGRYKLVAVKKTDVRRFYNSLVFDKGLKVNTVDTIHTVLHQIFKLAVEDNYIRVNPSDDALRDLKAVGNFGTDKKKALTLEQQNRFIEFVKDNKTYKHWLPLFTVMLNTGMRVGEVTGLRWQDVDFENRLININHTLVFYSRGKKEGCHFAVNTPKTKASIRTIPMTDTVAEAFEAEKRFQEELEVSCRVVIDGYTDFIFINRFGDTQHYGTVNKAIKRIIRDCNLESLEKIKQGEKPVLLPNFSSHTFRHTFATRMCEANVNIKAIQSILGHSDVRISLNVYTDATEDLKTRELSEYTEYMNKALSQ